MSGTIAITPAERWSAASWLFDWTVEFLAEGVADAEAAQYLRDIVKDNIGWLGLDELPSGVRTAVLRRIKAELIDAANETLPETIPNRPAVLNLLGELVELAQRAN